MAHKTQVWCTLRYPSMAIATAWCGSPTSGTRSTLERTLNNKAQVNAFLDLLRLFFPSAAVVVFALSVHISFGLPGHQSTLTPGVWHVLPVDADHMWAHADEAHARDAFERLARTLRLVVADSGLPRSPASRLPGEPPCAHLTPLNLRRSPRLLLKARRAREAAAPAQAAMALALARSELEAAVPDDGVFARGSSSGRQSHGVGNALRCDICSSAGAGTGRGVGGRGREMDGMSGASGGDDGVAPLEGGLLLSWWWRLGFWRALVFHVLLVVALGAAFFSWSALPIRTSPVVTTEGPCAMPLLQERVPATVELVVPVEGPITL